MGARNSAAAEPADRVLVITRVFKAPRAIVWKAWTDPEHLMRWWGPNGFVTTSCTMDLRAGGSWRIAMRSPEGDEHKQQGVFRQLEEPERLVFTYAFVDTPGLSGSKMLVEVSFAEHGEATKVTVRQSRFETVELRDAHVRGWNEALDHLAAQLAKF